MVLSYLGEIGLGFKVNSVEGLPSTTRRTENEKCGKSVARGGLKPWGHSDAFLSIPHRRTA